MQNNVIKSKNVLCVFHSLERHTQKVCGAFLCGCLSFWDTSIHWEQPLRNWKWAGESVWTQVRMSLACLSGSKGPRSNQGRNRRMGIKSKWAILWRASIPAWDVWFCPGGHGMPMEVTSQHHLQCFSETRVLEGEADSGAGVCYLPVWP